MNRPLGFLLIAAMPLWTSHCSSPVAGGSTTETTNSIVASAVDASGARVAGALARVRPADYLVSRSPSGGYDARTVRDLETDRNGRIRLDSLPPGSYSLEFNDRRGEASLVRFEILGSGRHLDLGASTLAAFSEIKGSVEADAAAGKVRVEIYGLERQVLVDAATGRFSLTGLPAGTFQVRAFAESEDYGSMERVVAGLLPGQSVEMDTLKLTAWALEDYSQWQHSRALRINTTATGADVAGDLHGFPLQVRLDRTNFEFSQAQPGGKDIRFAKPDGTKLPYEIGYWEPDSGRASLWVLADTVRGHDSSQSIRMHWGKARASDFSNGGRVFRTSDGFVGAWHLDGGAQDASSYRIHGEVQGTRFVLGPMGLAAGFSGVGDRITFRNQAALNFGPGDFAASIWVWLDSLGRNQQLFCKREPMGGHLEIQVQPDGKARAHLRRLDSASYLESTRPLVTGQWHHLALARSSGSVRLFLDGQQEDSLDYAGDVSSASDLLLGQDIEEPESLHGFLDDLHLSGKARSPDWIKLQFENGKPGSTLLRME